MLKLLNQQISTIMNGRILSLLFLLGFAYFVNGQNFPIKTKGPLPDDVIASPKERAKTLKSISDTKTKKSSIKDFQLEIVTGSTSLLRSGNIYFNDEISEYIKSILDRLMENESEIAEYTKVYLSKNREVNAFSMGDGILIINVGLISRLQNEAELAFILGHEITHFKKNHSFDKYLGNKEMKKEMTRYSGNPDDLAMKLMRYSRESELEADKGGFQLFTESGYPAKDAIGALKMLEMADYSPYTDSIILKDFFYKPSPKFDSIFNRLDELKPVNYVELNKEKEVKKKSKTTSRFKKLEALKTHPDAIERIEKIQKQIDKKPELSESSKGTNPEMFERIKQLAILESMHSAVDNGLFSVSLYEALQSIQKNLEVEYSYSIACESLFWINYMGNKHEREKTLTKPKNLGVVPYQYLSFLLTSSKEKDLREVSDVLFEKALQLYPNNEDILVFYGRHVSGSNTSKAIELYKNYLELHPLGKHAEFVKSQLNQSKV